MTMKIVQQSDYQDAELEEFVTKIKRLSWKQVGTEPLPQWVADAANAFAEEAPRPDIEELRAHIDHSVEVARGWDDPHDRVVMLHSALKSYYLLKWLDFLEHHAPDAVSGPVPVDVKWAARVSFTPSRPMRL